MSSFPLKVLVCHFFTLPINHIPAAIPCDYLSSFGSVWRTYLQIAPLWLENFYRKNSFCIQLTTMVKIQTAGGGHEMSTCSETRVMWFSKIVICMCVCISMWIYLNSSGHNLWQLF